MLYWIYQLWKEAQESGADWAGTFSFLRILGYISVRAGWQPDCICADSFDR